MWKLRKFDGLIRHFEISRIYLCHIRKVLFFICRYKENTRFYFRYSCKSKFISKCLRFIRKNKKILALRNIFRHSILLIRRQT